MCDERNYRMKTVNYTVWWSLCKNIWLQNDTFRVKYCRALCDKIVYFLLNNSKGLCSMDYLALKVGIGLSTVLLNDLLPVGADKI